MSSLLVEAPLLSCYFILGIGIPLAVQYSISVLIYKAFFYSTIITIVSFNLLEEGSWVAPIHIIRITKGFVSPFLNGQTHPFPHSSHPPQILPF